MEKDDYE